jgi:hypothetical protein
MARFNIELNRFIDWAFEPTFWRIAFWATVIFFAFQKVGMGVYGWFVMTIFMVVVIAVGWLK